MHFLNVFKIGLLLITSEALTLESNQFGNKPNIDELVFDSSSSWFKNKRHENITQRAAEPRKVKSLNAENAKFLEKTVQNIIQIDKLSKENMQQFNSLNKCNKRLRALESELNNINSDIELITRANMNMKTPRYATRNYSKNGPSYGKVKQTKKAIHSDVQLPSASAGSPFFHSSLMNDIRKNFVNYLKFVPKIFLSLTLPSLLMSIKNIKMISSHCSILMLLLVSLPLLFQQTYANNNNSEKLNNKNVPTFSISTQQFQPPNDDIKTIKNMMKTRSESQIKNLFILSNRILSTMKEQSKQNMAAIAECHQRTSQFTRMAMANKRRIIPARTTLGKPKINMAKVKSNEVNQEINFGKHKYQLPPTLIQELGFYLAELEKNYNTIQNLKNKIDKLEKSKTIKYQQGPINETETEQNGCQSLIGDGFAQLIQLDTTDPDEFVKEQTVLCENNWLVIQQRQNAFETSFNRTWTEYADGFGFPRGDFWLGLKAISSLTSKKSYRLMIELTDWSDQVFTAHYDSFEVGSEQDFFRLSISDKYVGNASRDLIDDIYYGFLSQNGAYFSTYDNNKAFRTKDTGGPTLNTKNCALKSGGGWWFNNNHCLPVNLNGIYVTGASAPSARGIKWQAIRVHDRNYSLKKSKMKIIAN